MKQIQYKKFSWETHAKNWRRSVPNVCQFELTFKCALHCRHCYSDCYNRGKLTGKELNTRQVKTIIDKLHSLGVIWLCFTGGDPLERKDFLEIYAYAKEKGFIVTVFTNGYSMTREIADYLAKNPPFVVEITVNAASELTYKAITGIANSFQKTVLGLDLLQKKKIPLKVKTMATRLNYRELPEIKKFLHLRNIEFSPSPLIHARLNGEKTPCLIRLTAQEIVNLDKLLGGFRAKRNTPAKFTSKLLNKPLKVRHKSIFPCAAGGSDGINIDPHGNMFVCSCLRKPSINFLRSSTEKIKKTLFSEFSKLSRREFKTNSKCATCALFEICWGCPGKKFLETGSLEAPVEYFCSVAEALSSGRTHLSKHREKYNEEIKYW